MDTALMLIIAGMGGGIFMGILGWIESGEPFNARKFAGTIMRSAVSGMLASFAFQDVTNPTVWQYAFCVAAGMGIDAVGVTTGIKLE